MSARVWFWLLLCQAIWSGTYVAMKIASEELPIGAVVFLRYGLTTAAYLLLTPWLGLPRLARNDWGLVAALGALNFTLAPTLQVLAVQYTQAADVSILTALEPALTVLLAALLLRETIARRTWVTLALAITGMLILSGGGAEAGGSASDRLFGNSLFLTSMLAEISVTVAGGRLARRYPVVPTMAAMKGVGFLVAGLVYFGVLVDVDYAALSPRTWGALTYLGLLGSLFAYSTWYWALKQAEVNQAAMSLFLQPVTGAFFGWLLLSESIGLNTIAGGALICGAVAWMEWRRGRRAVVVSPPP